MFSMPVARRRCDMLLASGFVDDVIIFQENFLTMMESGDTPPLSLALAISINQSFYLLINYKCFHMTVHELDKQGY